MSFSFIGGAGVGALDGEGTACFLGVLSIGRISLYSNSPSPFGSTVLITALATSFVTPWKKHAQYEFFDLRVERL
jgi:hypothetical protein